MPVPGNSFVENVNLIAGMLRGDTVQIFDDIQSAVLQSYKWAANPVGVEPDPINNPGEFSAYANAVKTGQDAEATGADAAAALASKQAAEAAKVAAESARDASIAASDASGVSSTEAKLAQWVAIAARMTAESYAAEPAWTFVKEYTSNGDGTYSSITTSVYSALHYATSYGVTPITLTNKIIDDISNYVGANHIHYPIRNDSGATIPAGTVIFGSATQPGTDYINVETVTNPQTQTALGMVHSDIANNGTGLAINTGVMNDHIDTSGWPVGTILYPNTSGGLTDVKPTSGQFQACAVVTRSHATQGTLLIEFTEPKKIASTTQEGYVQLVDNYTTNDNTKALTASVGKWLYDNIYAMKGQPLGFVPLDVNTLIDSIYLPSYVDDVIEVATYSALPVTGVGGKIYIVIADETSGGNTSSYRWTGTVYAMVSNTLTAADIVNLIAGTQPRFSGVYIGTDTDVFVYESGPGVLGIRTGSAGAYKYFTFGADGKIYTDGSANRVLTTADEGTLDAGTLDSLDSTQFLRSDVSSTLNGTLTVNNVTIANPGPGNPSVINFLKNSDTAKIEVTEVSTDATEFAFKMSDNPQTVSDKFYWHIDSYTGDHADWRPLSFNGLNAYITAVSTFYNSKVIISESPFYMDGVNKNAYLKYLGTEGNITPNVSGNTSGGRLEMLLKVNSSLNVDVFVNQGIAYVLNGTAPITLTLTPDGTPQSIGNGNTCVFPTTGLVNGMMWQFSIYPGGGIITDAGNKYWHSGNDGSLSGLDADMLDGKHIGTSGSSVPLLNNNNTWSGQNVFDGVVQINSGAFSTDLTVNPQIFNTAPNILYFGNPQTTVYMEALGLGSISLASFWHSGNDGSGSTLDSDLLDGQHGAYYLAWANFTGLPTTLAGYGITDATPSSHIGSTGSSHGVASQSVNGFMSSADKTKLDGYDGLRTLNQKTDIPTAADLNTYIVTGLYHQNSNAQAAAGTNYPVALAGMLTVIEDGSMIYQEYRQYSSPFTTYKRVFYSTAWGAWTKEWNSLNDGSGSGLDAGLLEGQAGAYYLAWANFTGLPTTLAGYGISDAAPLSHVGSTGAAHGVASQSVNGFMSSTDKAKLDGVEVGATADQTKADIDALEIDAASVGSILPGALVQKTGPEVPKYTVGTGTVAGVWEGTNPNITSYYDGLMIPYRIPIAGASTTTLNINNLGAKTVYRWGTSLVTTHYPVDSVVWLTYVADLNGGCFLVQGDYDSTESYTVRWNSYVQNNATDAVGAYRPVLELADGTFGAVVIGSSVAANGNTVSSQTFRLGGQMLFYSSSTVVAAGATFTYVYEGVYNTVGEYWTNRGTTAWATAYMPMYLVGTPSADGSTFTLDGAGTTGTGFLTQTLPTTEDGKIYIKFGYTSNTTDGFRMSTDHPIYHYVNGAVTLWGSSDIARLSAPQTFTAAQRGAIATEDNAIDFSAKNNFSLTATAANITATNVASCVGQTGFIEIASAENITGWGTEFTFPDGIGGWSSTNAPLVSGTEVFGYAVVNSTTIRMGRVQ